MEQWFLCDFLFSANLPQNVFCLFSRTFSCITFWIENYYFRLVRSCNFFTISSPLHLSPDPHPHPKRSASRPFVFCTMKTQISLTFLSCFNPAVRLVGASNRTEGRVEIMLGGVWGTICDDHFDINGAHVICRLLGFPGALAAVTQGRFGQGAGQIWLDDVRCYGNESSLLLCPHGGIGNHNCLHSEDVGVVCQQRQQDPKLGRGKFSKQNVAYV